MRACLLVAFLAVLTVGCTPKQSAQPAMPAASPGAELTPAEDGREVFLANCSNCHGKNADADTPAGRAWNVADLHSAPVQQLTDEQLLQTIRQGKGRMPAWNAQLTATDLDHVLVYIRTLKARQ